MPKKNMTPEERKAFGAKMKAARLAAKEAKEAAELADQGLKVFSDIPRPTPEPESVSVEDYKQLVDLVQELQQTIKNNSSGTSFQTTPQVGARGIIGTYEKFSVNPAYYPDPRERLFSYMESTPAHRRFGFRDNYELQWSIETTNYQTIDGINTREPRFNVKLIGVIYDEETGQPSDKRYIVRQLTFHEDPDAALMVANQQGLPVDEANPREFLDEMRFLRIRNWLQETFFPPKFLPDENQMREEVIGNTLVKVFTASSRDTVRDIPFDKMDKKFKA